MKNKLLFRIKYSSTVILYFLICYSCSNTQTCNESDFQFSSYEIAVNEIKSAKFNHKDSFNPEDEWIDKTTFYSCDGASGFLIMETNDREYIHQGLPLEVWEKLKNSESPGSFYSRSIRGDYQYLLKE